MASDSKQIPRTMSPRWNDQGLIPVVTQDADTDEVLMLAWMNATALEQTLASSDVVYWSRSRRELWRKGATSGNTQRLVEARLDCDGDTLLLRVHQEGGACHTGRRNCFFYTPQGGEWQLVAEE
jgi:phosphoribosyl-AMP cyclohydrolase